MAGAPVLFGRAANPFSNANRAASTTVKPRRTNSLQTELFPVPGVPVMATSTERAPMHQHLLLVLLGLLPRIHSVEHGGCALRLHALHDHASDETSDEKGHGRQDYQG